MPTFYDLTVNTVRWCAVCGVHHVADDGRYCCEVCADPALDVPKPPKATVRPPTVPGPTAISRLAAGFARAWAGVR